jgi:hypothetical protein
VRGRLISYNGCAAWAPDRLPAEDGKFQVEACFDRGDKRQCGPCFASDTAILQPAHTSISVMLFQVALRVSSTVDPPPPLSRQRLS